MTSYASFVLVCRMVLGVVLCLSAVGKVLDFTRVSGLWSRIPGLSPDSGRILILVVVLFDVLFVVGLVFAVFSRHPWVEVGLRAIICTCAAFLVISRAIWTGLLPYEGCGCFGRFFEPGTTTHMVIRNALFLAMSIGARIEKADGEQHREGVRCEQEDRWVPGRVLRAPSAR